MIHGAELRVHFLKSFQKGSICENLSQKRAKTRKDGRNDPKCGSPTTTHMHQCMGRRRVILFDDAAAHF
jgi:hypothetical protein